MVINYLLATAFVALSCPAPKIVDSSGLGITQQEKQLIQEAAAGCEQNFPDLYPCVYRFEKVAEKQFDINCGPKVEQQSI